MPEPEFTFFGVFQYDPRLRELRKHGIRIKLQDQPCQVLELLLRHPGEVVTREELQKHIWGGDTYVDFEQSLNRAVSKLREALGDGAGTPIYIETLPRRGYRFIAPIETRASLPSPAPPAQQLPLTAQLPPTASAGPGWPLVATIVLSVAVIALAYRLSHPPPAQKMSTVTSMAGQEGAPAFSPDGKQIVFTWDGETRDNVDLYVKQFGTTGLLRLTNHKAFDGLPSWSPDGSMIAFFSTRDGGEVYLVSPLGGAEKRIAPFAVRGRTSWSPDSKYLMAAKAVHVDRPSTDGGALFLLPADGVEPPKVVHSPPKGVRYQDPAISRDGRRVAFTACGGGATGFQCTLHVARLDATFSAVSDEKVIEKSLVCGSTAWMPDNATLVFARISDPAGGPTGTCSLWRVSVEGGEPAKIELAGSDSGWPAIDNTGSRLAFSRYSSRINIYRLQNGEATPLIASTQTDNSPQYSPDGTRIAFSSRRQGEMSPWVANADGSGAQELSHPKSPDSGTPRWSPDGRSIAIDALKVGEGYNIWIVNADGGPPRQLTFGPGDCAMPSWSADGSFVYFNCRKTGRGEVWRAPAAGGQPVQVTRGGGTVAFESVDGKTLYYTVTESGAEGLWAKDLGSGEERCLVADPVLGRGIAVFPDGVFYLFAAGPRVQVRFFNFRASKSTVVGEVSGRVQLGLAVSPDRKSILVSKYPSPEGDVFLIENFR